MPAGALAPIKTPPPKPALDCAITALQAQVPPNPPDRTLGPGDSSGTIIGATVTLPANVVITLTGDLVVVATKLLDIRGRIEFGDRGPGQPTPNLTLVCTGGAVKIHHVKGGTAAPGAPDAIPVLPASAQGGAGENGGYVKVWGVSIEIDLEIAGDRGGDGGDATADNTAGGGWLQGLRGFFLGLPAAATGGQGGAGGDVILCAVETISFWTVVGGYGGDGGHAEASAEAGGAAQALGGPGNDGGDVTITGVGPQPVRVRIEDLLKSGNGGLANYARCGGGDAWVLTGGTGIATGSAGGKGGKIAFNNAVVTLAGGRVTMGDGGPGGDGIARGGDGNDTPFGGGRGGNAAAKGGPGGAAGPPVVVPLAPPAAPAPATAGADGYGGDADAVPGDGGNDTGGFSGGGASGSGAARGGANGGGTPAAGGTPGPTPPTPAAGGVGGLGAPATATQKGAP